MTNAILIIGGVLLAAAAGLAAAAWIMGGREPVYRVAAGEPAFVVALKHAAGAAPPAPELAPGVTLRWRADARHGLIGPAASYWDQFLVLTGGAPGALPLALEPADALADAYVAEVTLLRPPRLLLGGLRLLHMSGLWRIPEGETWTGPAPEENLRPDLLPAPENVAWLLAQPPAYGPAMFNFLKYKAQADYGEGAAGTAPVSGRAAYGRYGRVALPTVMRTGGALHFAGRVKAVLRPATGWEMGSDWDDLAVMRYPDPQAILSMERVPAYRASLRDRNAGLEKTVVTATEAELP